MEFRYKVSQFYRLTIPGILLPTGLLLLSIFHFTSIYYGSHFKHPIHHSNWNCQNTRWRLYLTRVALTSKYLQWNICAGRREKDPTKYQLRGTGRRESGRIYLILKNTLARTFFFFVWLIYKPPARIMRTLAEFAKVYIPLCSILKRGDPEGD